MHYARNLAALLNYCYPSRLIPAPNHVPWHADRRSAQGWQSQTEGEIFKGTDGACADPDTRIFPATGWGGRWQGPLPVLFNRLLRHTQVLCYFPCTPRATALRQARVSGGNLQNCAPSAACGGAMTEESNVPSYPHPPLHLFFAGEDPLVIGQVLLQ